MGTPDFAVPSLQALIDAGHEICAVYTQPDKPKGRGYVLTPPPVKELALEHGIPVEQPPTLRTEEAFSSLQSYAPELIVVVAYGKLLPKNVLELPRFGCVNVHGSLLPKYRGAAPIQWAVLNGDRVSGVTTMYMAEGLDTGDMIYREETPVGPDETAGELFDRLAIDNDNNARTLEEFTDYRTYMDYDIRILHMDGSYSLYSKVCEEKSGGETQTPFYVTVAASFVQLYGNNIGGEAAGLVMFDEAFNNMDDERIGGVLEFLRRLPLQIIIAAPPDKIQYISPAMEETLLVMTDEKVSYVEEYYNGAF